MNYYKKYILSALAGLIFSLPLHADMRNFYHKVDITSGNVYTFVLSNLFTAYGNYLCSDVMFDDSFQYTVMNGQTLYGKKISVKPQNLLGFKARDLFNDFSPGLKLGYKSDSFGSVNWGIFASAHYSINQFRVNLSGTDEYSDERYTYFKPGAGIYLMFGSIEQKLRVQLEIGAKYNFPLTYHGTITDISNPLNAGITSYYSLKFGGAYDFSGGIFVSVNHFDIFKHTVVDSFKSWSLGATFIITPKRSSRIYGNYL